MSTLDEQIGMRLKIARKSFGWKTATQFCNAGGIPRSTYSQHEKGHRSLTAELFMKYGELFDIEPGWLLTGLSHPCPKSKDKQSRKEFIDNEIRKLQAKNILPFLNQSPIGMTDSHVTLNIELFCKILIPAIEALNAKEILCNVNELIAFCLDVYNNIETLNTPATEYERLIHLSINSMLKGSTISTAKEAVVG